MVGYAYGDGGSMDNRLSRVAAITDVSGGGENFAQYTYLGAGTIVKSARPGAVPGEDALDLVYGSKDNDYIGLDRFGRVVDQLWQRGIATPVTLDEFKYAYDQAGNRWWRENVVSKSLGTPVCLDELYAHDGLSRLSDTRRGELAGHTSNPPEPWIVDEVFAQDWTLDGMGNWQEFNQDGSVDLKQRRVTNTANEIDVDKNHANGAGASITAEVGANWIDPKYDAAGNMIAMPKPGAEATRVHVVYDAWNRMVSVKADNGGNPGSTMATYEYDGLNRRIEKHVTAAGGGARDVDYYYNEHWQLLEDRPQAGAMNQYVWDVSYIDAPVVCYHDATSNGIYGEAGDSVRYYTTDANHNVTAAINALNGNVAERYVYDPYGKATVYSADDWVSQGAPDSDGFLYCGYQFDKESGLYLPRNRPYHPTLGKFPVRDPMGYAAGDGNLYRYAHGQPIVAVDPSGLIVVSGCPIDRVLHENGVEDYKRDPPVSDHAAHGPFVYTVTTKDPWTAQVGKLEKEILWTMLWQEGKSVDYRSELWKNAAAELSMASGSRVFHVAGSTQKAAENNLHAHLKARTRVVSRAYGKQFTFADRGVNNPLANTDYFVRLQGGDNVRISEQWKDDPLSALEYAMGKGQGLGCMAAVALTMRYGDYEGYHEQLRAMMKQGELTDNQFVKLMDQAKSQLMNPLYDVPDKDNKLNSFHEIKIDDQRRLWVPGDAGAVKNLRALGRAEEFSGLEGENIIYVGGGLFWGHTGTAVTTKTLDNWIVDVYKYMTAKVNRSPSGGTNLERGWDVKIRENLGTLRRTFTGEVMKEVPNLYFFPRPEFQGMIDARRSFPRIGLVGGLGVE